MRWADIVANYRNLGQELTRLRLGIDSMCLPVGLIGLMDQDGRRHRRVSSIRNRLGAGSKGMRPTEEERTKKERFGEKREEEKIKGAQQRCRWVISHD